LSGEVDCLSGPDSGEIDRGCRCRRVAEQIPDSCERGAFLDQIRCEPVAKGVRVAAAWIARRVVPGKYWNDMLSPKTDQLS